MAGAGKAEESHKIQPAVPTIRMRSQRSHAVYEQSIARRDAKMMLISQPLGPSASASCALHLAHTSFPPVNPLLSRTVNRLSKSATFERVGIGRADTA